MHYNSSRTGVRLIGPKPTWARRDGGEAGLHPSNIHDNAYAIGTIDFTGDMPVILGPDGPSLGGFVCPATIVAAELWKMGQLKAGDRVRFRAVTLDEARALLAAQHSALASLSAATSRSAAAARDVPAADQERRHRERDPAPDAGRRRAPRADDPPGRRRKPAGRVRADGAGSRAALPRARAACRRWRASALPGIIDLTPGIRSLQIHYDDARLPRERLLEILADAEAALPRTDDIEVPSRIVHLPLSWDDPATQLAIAKYMQSVRPDAPWCPSNIEFIRRINGLRQHRGGAATSSSPRATWCSAWATSTSARRWRRRSIRAIAWSRRSTTRRAPGRRRTPSASAARTCASTAWKGPGGYQFVGRTCQMWNRFHETARVPRRRRPGCCASSIRSASTRSASRSCSTCATRSRAARRACKIEETTFRMADYRAFLRDHATSIDAFKQRQQAAFEAERERWAAMPPPPEPPSATAERSGDGRRRGRCPPGATAGARRGARQRLAAAGEAGRSRARRRSRRRARDHEDGDAGRRARRRNGARASTARRAAR